MKLIMIYKTFFILFFTLCKSLDQGINDDNDDDDDGLRNFFFIFYYTSYINRYMNS